MNQLAENFLKRQKLDDELKSNMLPGSLQDEFNNYAFKVYLYGYIKKTIVFSAMQIKKKTNQISQREELSLNIIDPNFNEERMNLIEYSQNDFLDDITEFVVKDSSCSYDEISHDKKILKAVNTLTDRQKQILYMCVITGESDTLVAKKLGITKQGVNKTKKAALNKLRRKLYSNI
ncbi:hypothetical protein KQI88_05645 [Alkaliphilus sp. MSJ-5]|uniref:RNA polymerase sigma-70 region 4 domain-containing protein n=1 Tax=Alkaliphilus flagellatus TaxID=2841507 RepID=A0ABS6G060_9FIRM|nr:sigma factor-like helix-turn-helix DNA-binding protein [Alkaliphilus flagellatus]MBU5675891.1 hypothetical protein [Alkaliphilus flagellatus]